MYWAQGLLWLTHLNFFAKQSITVKEWISRLKEAGCSVAEYSFSRFETPCLVYGKFQIVWNSDHSDFHPCVKFGYLGSTTVTFLQRERNRVYKLKQLSKGRLISAELSLRWWNWHDNYASFVSLVLCPADNKVHSLALEHCFIAKFQPKLNYPFVKQHVQFKALGLAKPKLKSFQRHNYGVPAFRLCRRLRRRLIAVTHLPVVMESRRLLDFWTVLFSLAMNTRQSFEMAKTIRSHRYSTEELYLLYRMTAYMGQPYFHKCKKPFASALRFKNLSIPKANKSLTIPFLAHDLFAVNAAEFLTDLLSQIKDVAIPLYMPSHKVREAAHPTVHKSLYNHFQWLELFAERECQPFECRCDEMLSLHPHLDVVDGHVASSASKLSMSTNMAELITTSTGANYFVPFAKYLELSLAAFESWRNVHGLPSYLDQNWHKFVVQQWPLHVEEIRATKRFSMSLIRQFIDQHGKHLVVHCADHEPFHAHVFCPNLFCNVFLATFEDKNVFERVRMTYEQFQDVIRKSTPPHIVKQYRRGLKFDSFLPSATILLKRKKQRQKARSIISYKDTALARLLKACALVLFYMLKAIWPHSLGLQTLPELWKSLHETLQNPDQPTWHCVNDDLVGFFNAVPQSRATLAAEALIWEYFNKFHPGSNPQNLVFSVDLSSGQVPFRKL